jgi:hypothetical protein
MTPDEPRQPMQAPEYMRDGQITQPRWRALNAHLSITTNWQEADQAIETFCQAWRISRRHIEAELATYRHDPPPVMQ